LQKIQINLRIVLDGTIIDFETTHWDINLGELITAGFLSDKGIVIYQRINSTEEEFKKILTSEIRNRKRPWCAFNKGFEEKFLQISIDNDLQQHERESAFGALLNENLLDHYSALDDPCFNDEIKSFWEAYRATKDLVFLSKIIRHNYCCLVKEYYLNLRREKGFDPSEITPFPSSAKIEKKFIRKQLGIFKE